ncbi:MAG: PDC sensor domain-containing protein [Solirubrobacteraceae bacterium]
MWTAIAVWVGALGLAGYEIHETQGDGRRQLEQRFAIRADLASRFVQTYAAEVLTRERAQATSRLTKPRVAAADFKAVVVGGGYQAAVLLDAKGRLLQIAPAKPELLGTQIGNRYPYLRSALKGRAAVSPVVPAAAGGAPVVEFAAPFDTPQGRRVLSGPSRARRGGWWSRSLRRACMRHCPPPAAGSRGPG